MRYKRWVLIAAGLFCLGLVLGLTIPYAADSIFSEEAAALEEFASILETVSSSSFLIIIFLKNVVAILTSFILSPIFCLVPAIALLVNGWLLGLVAKTIAQEISIGYLLGGLLPHGIFEIPALILGEAAALSFGAAIILATFRKEQRSLLKPRSKANLKYLAIALALLLPAAIMETYVTPIFLK